MPSTQHRTEKNGSQKSVQLVGRSSKMREIAAVIERVAKTDIPVLICGESGSGKEVVAHLLHQQSARQQKPFLKVNCASIPHDLLESELFGYERGSFTGAVNSKPGKFEMAHEGTIFLDEISEIGLRVQPKLLQVLQDKQFCRLGAQREVTVDVRFFSSSNRPLDDLLAEGKFRKDLYYRLNVITIQLPALRERKEDLPELAEYLLRKHDPGPRPRHLSERLLNAFLQYDWPGNVRELENIIRRLVAVGEEAVLSDNFTNLTERPFDAPLALDEDEPPILSLKEVARQAAWQAEREMILLALKKTNWNRKQAAELLQISYKAMLYKLKDAGLAKHSRTVYSA